MTKTATDPINLRGYLRTIESQIERRIDALWDDLAASLDAKTCSESQFAWVLDQEHSFGDSIEARWVFSHFLARCASRPDLIGITANDGETFPCPRCLAGRGWMENAQDGGWFPCPACNDTAYELFMDGHYKADHTCPKCDGRRVTRGRAGGSHHDEVQQQRTVERARDQETIEGELF